MYYILLFLSMARQKEEPTKIQTFRFPVRIIKLLRSVASEGKRSLNAQVWIILEDWLEERGHLKESDRRR